MKFLHKISFYRARMYVLLPSTGRVCTCFFLLKVVHSYVTIVYVRDYCQGKKHIYLEKHGKILV
jgi:hypothetical protein